MLNDKQKFSFYKMYSQRIRRNHNVSVRSILDDFLIRINYNRIYLPFNNAQIIAAQIRSSGIIQKLTGMDLMKRNVKSEANRLHVHSQYIIHLATNHIWNFSTILQQGQFTNLANDVNNINQNHMLLINNTDTLVSRMSQITRPQVTNIAFGNSLFNGIDFP